MIRKITTCLVCFLCTTVAQAQKGYSNYTQQAARLQTLAKNFPQWAKLKSIAKTAGGKDIWLLVLGTGNTDNQPAMAVIGGVEGNHLLGTELAIGFAEKLLAQPSDSCRLQLSKTTFYIFPNMSPDAMEQYFASVRYERKGNAIATDDDRDGKTDEDGYDDLDGNGKITQMRVLSSIGDYLESTGKPGTMIKADITKGEKGKYLVYSEGLDNDKDGKFNEDGEGGNWFNKNLTYRHPSFTPGSGEYPVSEIETRALLDELYSHFNIYAVVSFSSNNNLSTPITFNAANASQRIPSGYAEQDARVNAVVSDLYNKATRMKDAPKTIPAGGDLLSWAYFHYGRFSFSTPGWHVPKAIADKSKKADSTAVKDSVGEYFQWAAANNIPVGFTPWMKYQHPDFPGQQVEIGGPDPFIMTNPPFSLTDSLVTTHTAFLCRLASLQPTVEISQVIKEKVSKDITRVTATIINSGLLPSHTKIGERSYWVKKINVKINGNVQVISGKKIQLLGILDGFSSRELQWLLKGNGTVILEAGSPSTGTVKSSIIL